MIYDERGRTGSWSGQSNILWIVCVSIRLLPECRHQIPRPFGDEHRIPRVGWKKLAGSIIRAGYSHQATT
jgi:hypothetical protein